MFHSELAIGSSAAIIITIWEEAGGWLFYWFEVFSIPKVVPNLFFKSLQLRKCCHLLEMFRCRAVYKYLQLYFGNDLQEKETRDTAIALSNISKEMNASKG